MAYEASLQDKWIWDSAMSMAEKKAAEKAAKDVTEKERAKAEQEKYNMQLTSARSLKGIGVLTNEQIAKSLKLPLEVVKKLK